MYYLSAVKFLPVIIIALFIACSNDNMGDNKTYETYGKPAEVSKEKQVPVIDGDTAVIAEVVLNKELEDLITKFQEANFPVIVDSSYIESAAQFDSLSRFEVILLTQNMSGDDQTSASKWNLETFHKIDSLKSSGVYNDYVKSLDIGQMKKSNCFALNRIKHNDSTELLTWALTYSTYEACPYASGTYLFVSLVHKGQIGQCVVVGEIMGAGDPPVSMERSIYSIIENDGTISSTLDEIHMDEDSLMNPIVADSSYEEYRIQIIDGNLAFLK